MGKKKDKKKAAKKTEEWQELIETQVQTNDSYCDQLSEPVNKKNKKKNKKKNLEELSIGGDAVEEAGEELVDEQPVAERKKKRKKNKSRNEEKEPQEKERQQVEIEGETDEEIEPTNKKKKKDNSKTTENNNSENDNEKSISIPQTSQQESDDNDSVHLSEESDIDLEDSSTDLQKRMRKIRKRQMPEWDLENVDYPKSKGQAIPSNLISNAPLHQLFPRICNISADEAVQIKRNKINWVRGKFTEKENEILKQNWEKYLEDNHIPNAALLFGMFRRGKEIDSKLKDYYRLFFVESKLMLRLAKDLPNRRLQQIYQRARQVFVGLKQGSDFTEEDHKLILKLHRVHGEKYAMFCEKYGFNPKSAREFIRNHANGGGNVFKRGPWSDEEVDKLREVVGTYMKNEKLTSYDRISWTYVASQMNRSDIQCRSKFYSKAVYQLMSRESNIEWDKKLDFAKFIALLKKMDVKDEFQIDWDFVNQIFGVQLFNVLHSAWRMSKFKVPDNDKKSFSEIVDYIYNRKVNKPFGHDDQKMEIINQFVENALD